jgi:hypothetical protein
VLSYANGAVNFRDIGTAFLYNYKRGEIITFVKGFYMRGVYPQGRLYFN